MDDYGSTSSLFYERFGDILLPHLSKLPRILVPCGIHFNASVLTKKNTDFSSFDWERYQKSQTDQNDEIQMISSYPPSIHRHISTIIWYAMCNTDHLINPYVEIIYKSTHFLVQFDYFKQFKSALHKVRVRIQYFPLLTSTFGFRKY